MKRILFFLLLTFPYTFLHSQIIVGYNNPTVGSDSPIIGTIPWINPTNIFTSDDVRASSTLDQQGVTNYLRASNFGFILPAPCPACAVTGVEAQIERRSLNQPDVLILNPWISFAPSSTGAGPYNFTVTPTLPPAIVNRALIVIIG